VQIYSIFNKPKGKQKKNYKRIKTLSLILLLVNIVVPLHADKLSV